MSDRLNFDELAGGDDLSPEEAARLERVHDLLVAAGPPPELPPHLREPDHELERRDNVTFLPRRRAGMLLGIAAAVALLALLGGYVLGQRQPFHEAGSVAMRSTVAGSTASAVIHVGKADSAGNWPLKVDVKNLPALPKGQYYEMFLSRGANRRAASCGTFRVTGSSDEVRLNAPYRLRAFDGWIVTREKPGSSKHPVVLTTA
jgi:hypothetical protein